jgi:regulatory protein
MNDDSNEAPGRGSGRRRRTRKAPPRVSAGDFQRAALRHLERYPSSTAGLKAVLQRRAQRSHDYHEDENLQAETEALIEAAVLKMTELGFLDDRRYGQALARRLRSRGGSLRKIAAQLHQKGIPSELRDELLAEAGGSEAELEAALTYARRRRLGVHRRNDPLKEADGEATEDAEVADARRLRRKRELGALARAGFGFDIAARVLGGE